MPNGHGGSLKWGMPVLLLGGTVASLVWYSRAHGVRPAAASLVLAALGAWRFSFHATMWDVTEYGGAYTAKEKMREARRRHLRTTIVGGGIALAVVSVVLWALR